ncbi:MAG: tryptophan--tRNA ligase, partial [Patescibacteria group bacterium]
MPDLLFSAVQPTANLHIGNYIGALKQWIEIQHRYRCVFCVVDLHAITMPQDPKMLRENILNVAATYLAVGIDPARCHIFVQSEVPEHAELGWILGTLTKIAELERMTQFKDKSKKQNKNV